MEKEMIQAYKDYAELRKSIGSIQKSGVNPHFKNTYVELNTALQVVDEHIGSHNFICFVQVPRTIESKNYLNTKLVHNTGFVIEGDLELLTTRVDPQMLGSSLTYARRNSLLTILGLKAEDDDGNDASDKGKTAEKAKAKEEAKKQAEAKKRFAEKLQACKTFKEIDDIINNLSEEQRTDKLMSYVGELKAKMGNQN